jgi:hypothetical protein
MKSRSKSGSKEGITKYQRNLFKRTLRTLKCILLKRLRMYEKLFQLVVRSKCKQEHFEYGTAMLTNIQQYYLL